MKDLLIFLLLVSVVAVVAIEATKIEDRVPTGSLKEVATDLDARLLGVGPKKKSCKPSFTKCSNYEECCSKKCKIYFGTMTKLCGYGKMFG